MMPSRRGRLFILLDSRAGPNAIASRPINFTVDSRADCAEANYFNIDYCTDCAEAKYFSIHSRAPLRRGHYFIIDSCAAIRCHRCKGLIIIFVRGHLLPLPRSAIRIYCAQLMSRAEASQLSIAYRPFHSSRKDIPIFIVSRLSTPSSNNQTPHFTEAFNAIAPYLPLCLGF